MASVWLFSFIGSALLTGWNVTSVVRSAAQPDIVTLNSNLEKIGLFWSLSAESFKPLAESTPESDLKKATRSCFVLGALGFFSLPGFVLLLIVTLSMRLLTSRFAKRVYASDLTKKPALEKARVQELVDALSKGIAL